MHLRDPDARPEVRRLDEQRIRRALARCGATTPAGPARHSARRTTTAVRARGGRARGTGPSSPPCPSRPPRPARRSRRRRRWPARAGPGWCRLRRSGPCSTGKITSRPRPVSAAAASASSRARRRGDRRARACRRRAAAAATLRGRRAARCGVAAHLLDDVGGRRRRRRTIGEHPASVLLDADRDRLVALAIEVGEHGGGRGQRHFVLARSAAVHHADSKTFHGVLAKALIIG